MKSKGGHRAVAPKDEEQGDDTGRRRREETGGNDDENQGLLRSGSGQGSQQERDDSVLFAADLEEQDARSLRGGSLLPTGQPRQPNGPQRILDSGDMSPVYPPAAPKDSMVNLPISEKVLRPTVQPNDDEKSDNGWDWLDEDEEDEKVPQTRSGRSTPLQLPAGMARAA